MVRYSDTRVCWRENYGTIVDCMGKQMSVMSTLVLIPPIVGIFLSAAFLSTVFRILDWNTMSNATAASLSPIECGFDATSTVVGGDRMVVAFVLISCFEVELLVLSFLFVSTLWSVLLVVILVLFGLLELNAIGR